MTVIYHNAINNLSKNFNNLVASTAFMTIPDLRNGDRKVGISVEGFVYDYNDCDTAVVDYIKEGYNYIRHTLSFPLTLTYMKDVNKILTECGDLSSEYHSLCPPRIKKHVTANDVKDYLSELTGATEDALDLFCYIFCNDIFAFGSLETAILITNKQLLRESGSLLILPPSASSLYTMRDEWRDTADTTPIKEYLRKCIVLPDSE